MKNSPSLSVFYSITWNGKTIAFQPFNESVQYFLYNAGYFGTFDAYLIFPYIFHSFIIPVSNSSSYYQNLTIKNKASYHLNGNSFMVNTSWGTSSLMRGFTQTIFDLKTGWLRSEISRTVLPNGTTFMDIEYSLNSNNLINLVFIFGLAIIIVVVLAIGILKFRKNKQT